MQVTKQLPVEPGNVPVQDIMFSPAEHWLIVGKLSGKSIMGRARQGAERERNLVKPVQGVVKRALNNELTRVDVSTVQWR